MDFTINCLDLSGTCRGYVLEVFDRYEEALVVYIRVTELDPDGTDGWYNRGWVLHALERYDEAVAAYDQVLSLDSDHAGARENREDALGELQSSQR